MREQIEIRAWRALDYIDDIQRGLHSYYAKPPWNDNWICSVCVPATEETFATWWSHKQGGDRCVVCGAVLEQFWTTKRAKIYVSSAMSQKDSLFLGVFNKSSNQIIGWLWGYRKVIMDKDCFYIDMIGIRKEYRRKPGIRDLIFLALYAIKARLSPSRRMPLIDFLLEKLGVSISGLLFLELSKCVKGRFRNIATQTHETAKNVIRVLRVAGFGLVKNAPTSFPDRIIMMRPI